MVPITNFYGTVRNISQAIQFLLGRRSLFLFLEEGLEQKADGRDWDEQLVQQVLMQMDYC